PSVSRCVAGHGAVLNCERSSVLVMLWRCPAKVDRPATINRRYFVHVWPVENIERVHRQLQLLVLPKSELIRETNVVRVERVTAIRISRRQPYAIRHGVRVVVNVVAYENCEGPTRLKIQNIAELEILEKSLGRSVGHNVRDEAMPNILYGIRPFQIPFIQILGRADERGERAIVEGVGESVVRIEVEVLAHAPGQRDVAAVVHGDAT